MKNYKEVIEKEVKDASFYLPVLGVLKKSKSPLSIKEIAELLNITYGAAKPRLHKLEKWNLINRMKRGYYCLPTLLPKYNKTSTIRGDLFFINGCIRIMGSSNGIWITIYNSKFGDITNGEYCLIENFEKDKVIIRKSNKFIGNKLYLLLSRSVGISIPRKLIPENVLNNLSTNVIPIKIGISLSEWGISIADLFGTESKEDGELAEELNKIGEVKKPSKFESLKADIIFNYQDKKIPIEVTTISISQTSNQPQHGMSSIKASQIIMRFYFSIKWNYLHGLPTILIIHKDWAKQRWIQEEEKFMKKFNCYILFTDFQGNWAKQTSQDIKRLTESSRIKRTTLLTST